MTATVTATSLSVTFLAAALDESGEIQIIVTVPDHGEPRDELTTFAAALAHERAAMHFGCDDYVLFTERGDADSTGV